MGILHATFAKLRGVLQPDVARARLTLQLLTAQLRRARVTTVLMAAMATKTAPPKILVVDDDVRLRDLLTRYLGEQGFQVSALADARDIDKKLQRDPPHLVVLDLMLPGEDGLSVCRRLRGAGETVPIIMLTAKGEEVDRIVGLEMGADDYLPKPFNPRELVARIHAVLRRQFERLAPGAPGNEGSVPFGPYALDLSARALLKDGASISLTTGEFSLLKVFVQHPRQPLAREKLMMLARGRDHEVFDRAIDVQVSRLRKLIETDPANPRFIQTVWGFGYVYVPDLAVPPEEGQASPVGDAEGAA
jgi:two-component system, OmpR family, phosphate regulon response regulator OmpR